jgi:hypothetical protein
MPVLSRLFIQATIVNQGGGCTLLNALHKALPYSLEVHVSLDSRMPMPESVPESVRIKRVKPSVFERFKAEKWFAYNACSGDVIPCFGNLPPLFKMRGSVVVWKCSFKTAI